MTGYDHGPLQSYEITWTSGHVETVQAHQVLIPMPSAFLPMLEDAGPPRVMLHGEIDGHWRLILAADAADIRTIRNVTLTEVLTSSSMKISCPVCRGTGCHHGNGETCSTCNGLGGLQVLVVEPARVRR